MPSQLGGMPSVVENNMPQAIVIASTTSGAPLLVTTTAPHGCKLGDYVRITGAADPAANGSWIVIPISATVVELRTRPSGSPAAGSIAGGVQGTLRSQGFGLTFPVPSDLTDPRNAASVNVAFEALADRTAWLQFQKANLEGGNTYTGPQTFGANVAVGGVLTVAGAASVAGALTTGSASVNGTLTVSGAESLAGPLSLTGSQPASSADPGGNNRLFGTNIAKAFGNVTFASGVITINDGFNVASVSLPLGSIAAVTFSRALANDDYVVAWGAETFARYPCLSSSNKTASGFQFNVLDLTNIPNVVSLNGVGTTTVSFVVFGRQ